jgi:methionyl-tRNA formyltransferase
VGLKIAIFGQAAFGKEVTERLADAGHSLVGVYVPPDDRRPDPLAELAQEREWPLFRHRRYRRKGEAIPELVDEYRALGADLNVLPFTTAILPPEIIDPPRHGSLCFHPSLLPAYRGGAALAWQIILGATESGVTVFKVEGGVDEGPIVVQKAGVPIDDRDTTASLYFEKLYALGVDAMLEAVAGVAAGTATMTGQPSEGASFQGLVTDEVARIDWSRPGVEVDRLIRGCTPAPGALATWEGVPVRLFGSRRLDAAPDAAEPGTVLGSRDGELIVAAGAARLSVAKVRIGDGKKVAAADSALAEGARLT